MCISLSVTSPVNAEPGSGAEKFNQLDTDLPTANVYRTAGGEPGPDYWQQSADYIINVELDEGRRHLKGSEIITYTNNAPTPLRYIWIQLDQNRFSENSLSRLSETSGKDKEGNDQISYSKMRSIQSYKDNEHGYKINNITDESGKKLSHTIVDTMMRIDLPSRLNKGDTFKIKIDWEQNIIDEVAIGGRGGYEHFPESDTDIFFLAQWYPRVAAFTDYTGWQHKAFLGRGEFTLEFGNYDVSITVPEDHIVSATGELKNSDDVLTPTQQQRLETVNNRKPVFIVTPEEALENEKQGTRGNKTWHFSAENVRDFAFASSRKFIWDAMKHVQDDDANPEVLAMSFYPNEAEPIWSQYSTHSVVHTMEVYSRFSFPYPYPTAQSVNTWERGGMEYPMITFNGYRPEKEDDSEELTYSRGTKYSLIGVIIHEIGHIYFPMIVNSDERQWTWMDEGLNTFLETIAEAEWEENFPAYDDAWNVQEYIWQYMIDDNQVPIMTQSDSILQFGPNAYSKPTAALIYLREYVMGRELFDFAFKEYSRRWKFKRPTPADFFRTMEDASGIDLDWFWKGWFYTTDHLDIGITDIREYRVADLDPEKNFSNEKKEYERDFVEPQTQIRNREEFDKTRVERMPELKDFYNENDRFTVTNKNRNDYKNELEGLEDWERHALERALKDNDLIYFIDFENKGGLVTPLTLTIEYERGKPEQVNLPAEIWRRDAVHVTKMWITKRKIESIILDLEHQTPDADRTNNHYPRKIIPTRIELYKGDDKRRNLMSETLVELKGNDKSGGETDCDCNNMPMEPAR
jgi:hypothetical protein